MTEWKEYEEEEKKEEEVEEGLVREGGCKGRKERRNEGKSKVLWKGNDERLRLGKEYIKKMKKKNEKWFGVVWA